MLDLQSQQSKLQDRLLGALIGLARATDGNEHLISESSTAVIVEGLAASGNDSGMDPAVLEALLLRVEEEKRNMVPDCYICAAPCGRTSAYDMEDLRHIEENARNRKLQLLSMICRLANYAKNGAIRGESREEVDRFFYKALIVIGLDSFGEEGLLSILQEADEVKAKAMNK